MARTVVLGGLFSADMADDVHRLAKEIGAVCSVTYPLAREDLEQHGRCSLSCTAKGTVFSTFFFFGWLLGSHYTTLIPIRATCMKSSR